MEIANNGAAEQSNAAGVAQADGQSQPNVSTDITATIVRATQFGDLDLFRTLIESGHYDVNRMDKENVSLLHWAAINNRVNFISYMLSKGVQVDRIGGELQSTPLHWAVRQGHLAATVLLVQNGASLSSTDGEGYSPLHLAAMSGRSAILSYLLANGADVDVADRNGMTPLMWAAFKAHSPDPTRLLVQFQAKLNARDNVFGNTAFGWAAMSGNGSAIRVLFDSGADASLKNDKFFDPSNVAIQYKQYGVYGTLAAMERECALRKRGFPFSTLCTQQSRNRTAFVVPTIFFLGFCILLELRFAWWIQILGIAALVAAIFATIQMVFDSSYLYKLPFGLMVTTKMMLILTFWWFILPHTNTFSFFGFSVSCAAAVILAVLITSRRTDMQQANMHDKIEILKAMAENPDDAASNQLCTVCLIRRPLRARHCSICKRCVSLYDHHSSWLYTCIGWRNQKFYLLYLVSLVSTIVFYLYACTQFWAGAYAMERQMYQTFSEYVVRIGLNSTTWVSWAALNCLMHLAWSGIYLIYLLHQITFVGMTTDERVNAFRNRMFQTERIGVFRSPFNRSPLQNWADFFQCKLLGNESAAVDWRRVFSLDDYRKQLQHESRRGASGRLLPI